MANTIVQVRRSNTSSSPGTVLAAGELAYSYNSNNIYVGAQTGVGTAGFVIGGAKFAYVNQTTGPGTQTANATVILDANSFVSNTFTTGLVVQGTSSTTIPVIVSSISNTANSSVLGANASGGGSGLELATTAAMVQYIGGRTGAAVGANGNFLFNNSGITTGATNFNYDYNTGSMTVGNTTVNVQMGYLAGNNQMMHWHGSMNTYVQVMIQNANNGPNSSADYVVEVDNSTDTSYYVDLGLNSSTWSNTGWTISGANDGYLYNSNGTMSVGTASAKPVTFFANGTLAVNEVMRIDAGANVGIGNTNPNAKLAVTGTANISGLVTLGGSTIFNGNVQIGTAALAVGLAANGSYGSAGQVLASNGTSVYWASGASATPGGANTQIQFNNSGTLGGTAGFTFTTTSNNVAIANNLNVNTVSVTTNTQVGSNVTVNTTAFSITGNSTVSTATVTTGNIVYGNSSVTNAPIITLQNSTSTSNLTSLALTLGTVVVNTVGLTVGSNVTTNVSAFAIAGNSTVSTATITTGNIVYGNSSVTNAPIVTLQNSTSTSNLTSLALTIGSTVVNASGLTATLAVANLSGSYANISGQVNAATLFLSTTANVGANVQLTTSTLTLVGNSTTQPTINVTTSGTTAGLLGGNSTITGAPVVLLQNSSSQANLTSATLTIGTSVVNSTAMAMGIANVTTLNVATAYVTTALQAAYANVTGQVNTATLFVTTSANIASSNVIANTAGVFVANSTGVVNAAVHSVGTAFIANSTMVTFTGANIVATSGYLSIRDILATGNLTVQGTLTTIDTTNLQVKDNLIQLADQQASTVTFTDAVDTGLYQATGNTLNTFYSGIARIAASSSNTNPYYKIFETGTAPGTTTIDTGANTGTLQAYLLPYGTGGVFVANSLTVTVTANSTVNVNLTANSLSLSTALGATSGGTGTGTYAAGDLLYSSATNTLSKLTIAANGNVLQVTNNLPAWGGVDGGTF